MCSAGNDTSPDSESKSVDTQCNHQEECEKTKETKPQKSPVPEKKVVPRRVFSGILAAVAAAAAIPVIKDWLFPYGVSAEANMDIKVPASSDGEEREGRMYEIFSDAVSSTGTFKGYLINKCATRLIVTNRSGGRTTIRKFGLQARDIMVDDTPYLSFNPNPPVSFPENGVPSLPADNIRVTNCGWSDAINVSFTLKCESTDFCNIFGKSELSRTIEFLPVGVSSEFPFLQSIDVVNPTTAPVNLKIEIEVDSPAAIWRKHEEDNIAFDVVVDGGNVSYAAYGQGGGEAGYGILIPTDGADVDFERPVDGYLETGETSIPLCLFPDKSCSLKFQAFLEIGAASTKVKTQWTQAHFLIDSSLVGGDAPYINAESVSEEEIVNALNRSGFVAVSYPFADADDYAKDGR